MRVGGRAGCMPDLYLCGLAALDERIQAKGIFIFALGMTGVTDVYRKQVL